jgi:hypothetical protein
MRDASAAALLSQARCARVAAAEHRDRAEAARATARSLRPATLVEGCAWCGRFHLGGRWTVASFGAVVVRERVTHGICVDCFAEIGCAV